MKCPTINLEALTWYDPSDARDGTRLLSSIQIGPCLLHLQAIELHWNTADVQQGINDDIEEEFVKIFLATDSADPWDTVTIKGRTYGLYAYPYNNGTTHP